MSDDTINRQAAIEICDWYEQEFPECEYMVRLMAKDLQDLPSSERRGRWTIEAVHQYELAYGTTAYEPVYKCSCCGLLTESYLRLDEPIMPDDADFPKWCGNCGARMEATE